ncbi:MAG: ATP-binding protein, partial [Acidimicrobiales bacterium]
MPSDRSGVEDDGPRLQVHLLGTVEVTLDGERLRDFDALRLQRFLALLLLRPELSHRSRIAFELWPDSDESQARTNLRKLIHDVRNSLPDHEVFVEITNEVVRWLPDGPSRADVIDFHTAAVSGDVQLAASHYSGDLLPACYDDWVLDERARARSSALSAFTRLAHEGVADCDFEKAVEYSRRALDLEPTDEEAVRTYMEANVNLDQRAAALQGYHRYTEILDRDLGVGPSPDLEALYRRLRQQSAGAAELEGGHERKIGESPFVGRLQELKLLHDTWDNLQGTGAHLVVVTGEPGIGKSRLAEEFGRRIRAEGHLVASAGAYEAAGRLPWGPIVDLLRSDALRSQVETLEQTWRTELARLLPELRDRVGKTTAGHAGELAQRRRMFDAVSRAIIADARPRLLILDDLQWCDAETLELIGFLIRAADTEPVLVVGTLRAEEVLPDHPVNELTSALGRDGAATTVALAALDAETTASLAARLGEPEAKAPEYATRLWAETEGNPLFVVEAVRAGVPETGPGVLTPTMRAVLRARLDQLNTRTRRVAEVAAVIGRPFTLQFVATATGVSEQQLVDEVDELWRRRIIRDQGHSYDFSHDKLRAVAVDMLSPARRRQIHRAIAETIRAQADGATAAARLAAHY